MSQPIMSEKKAKALTFALLLVGLAILTLIQQWWPGIALVIGLPLALRQYLLGKRYDMAITLFVFIGIFITVQFNIAWQVILPVLFTFGAVYIFAKEFFGPNKRTEVEKEEDINKEIEEEKK